MNKTLQSIKLSLLNTNLVELDDRWNYDNVVSPFSRLYYVVDGEASVAHNEREYKLKPGHMYLIPSYSYSRYKCENYLKQYYIGFLEEMSSGLSIFDLREFVYEVKATDIDLYYFERLLKINPNRYLINDDPEIYDNRVQLLAFKANNELLRASNYLENKGLLTILFSRFLKDAVKKQTAEEIKTVGLRGVLKYVNENLQNNISVKILAEHSNLCTDYFSRVFYKKYKMRPVKYIQSKRIERAQLLLLTTDYNIKQIAQKVGLDNVSNFSKVFKSVTGVTPGAYRRN